MILGLAIMAVLAIVLGIVVHFGVAIAMIVIYIITTVIVMRKLVAENDRSAKQIHFNICLLIRNENERLYQKHSLRAKVGHMGRRGWAGEHRWSSPYPASGMSTHERRRALSMQASTIWQMWYPLSKVGHMGRWIEFHGVSSHSLFGIELEQIEESVSA